MWVYSITQATSAEATSRSSTHSSSRATTSYNEEHNTAASASATAAQTLAASESSTRVENPYETLETYRSVNSESNTNSFTQPGTSSTGSGSASESYEEQRSLGFTRSTYGTTTVDAFGGTTTSSSESTQTRSRESYASTTTTQTVATNSQVTTTVTSTRAITTTTSPSTTTSSVQTFTNTTSTNSAVTVTSTVYAYAPSTTLSAPESLVPISEAEPTEQAWAATASDSAGYPFNVAASFTKRTGTLSTTSYAAPLVASTSFASTQTRITGVGTTLTLTTTLTTSSVDTYCPANSVYPATATATRSFAMLTTGTTTTAVGTTATTTSSFNYPASCYAVTTTTHRAFFSSLVPVTINASPTATSATSFHMTWFSSTQTPIFLPTASNFASSASGSGSGSSNDPITVTATGTTTATTTRTTETDTIDTVTETVTFTQTTSVSTTSSAYEPNGTTQDETTASGSATFSTIEFFEFTQTTVSGFTTFTVSELWTSESGYTTWTSATTTGITEINNGTVTTRSTTSMYSLESETTSESYSSFWFDGINFTNSSTSSNSFSQSITATFTDTFSGTFEAGTSSYSTTTSATTTGSFTQTTTTLTTTDTTQTTTTSVTGATATFTGPATQTSSSQSSFVEGSSLTHPFLHSQSTFTGSSDWTAHAFHPRNGFRHPISLANTDPLYSELSASPSIYYPPKATQDDSAGAITPVLYTAGTSYLSGVSTYSAQWQTSDSRLHYTLSTVSSTSTTGTVSFAGATPASWFSHISTTGKSTGASVIGGVAVKSEYKAAVYTPPGVLRWTRQTDGTTSSSNTTWTQSPLATDGSNLGFALPTRDESVWSVTTRSTRWTYDTQLSQAASTGDTSTPVMLVSLNPNL